MLLARRQSLHPNDIFPFYGAKAHIQSRNRSLVILLCSFSIIFYTLLQNVKPLNFTGQERQPTSIAMRVVPEKEFLEHKKLKKEKLVKITVEDSEFCIIEPPVFETPVPKPKEKVIPKPKTLPQQASEPLPKAMTETKVEPESVKLAEENVPKSVASATPTALLSTNTQADEQSLLLASLLQEIERYKKYPKLARRRSLEGTIDLILTLDAQGTVIAYKLRTDRGAPLLKEATSRLGQRLVGFTSKIDTKKQLQIHIPIQYSLKTR